MAGRPQAVELDNAWVLPSGRGARGEWGMLIKAIEAPEEPHRYPQCRGLHAISMEGDKLRVLVVLNCP